MPSLLDIAPPDLMAEEVEIRGTKLKVQGVTGEGWMLLYARHLVLRQLVSGRIDDLPPAETFAAQVALVAAGLGQIGDEDTERLVMDRLTRAELGLLTEAVIRLSMPGHLFGPLLDEGGADSAAAPSTAEPVTK